MRVVGAFLFFASSILPASSTPREQTAYERLLNAIEVHSVSEVNNALASGADPNRKNGDGITPLAAATRLSFADIIEVLLKNGADPNLKDGGATPLYYAALFDCKKCADILSVKGGILRADEGQIKYLEKFEHFKSSIYWRKYLEY